MGTTRKEEAVAGNERQSVPAFAEGISACAPTLIGYASIGIASGMVGIASQLSISEVALLAALVYAGAAQFIICALLAAGSPAYVIIFTTFIVNLRHLLLSMTLAPHFARYSLVNNISIGALVTDETFGVAANRLASGGVMSDRWMHGLNWTAYIGWILSCVTGAVFGRWISDPARFGMDFALTAMFLALLVLQLHHLPRGRLRLYGELVGYSVLATLLLGQVVPMHLAVLLATAGVAAIGVVRDR
ncbi:branched-chain amino acid ABC transporter permease [Xylanibacillus composti]|uniref:4-azaleucine resistance transporter AzlC n=1 Tax=Xylanibacillus composti TaxID=1572762 RepID=A0A8J4H676_9BACL|nr:AzlC family ABC transporter permease [Xylanibacillus composti]MDT9724035.1 branched-chain amino acid ABC transporter permease [Xylanibacillus composti]GIQ69428.1 hypothetical protein XYCOK13_22520 [Xylanibacillus composti]